MYFTLFTAVALFVAPALADFAVNNPNLKQCETSKISWEATEGPYNVIIVDAADPCGEPLVEVGDFEGTFVDWKAILPAGKVVQVSIADKKDDEAWSGNITVGASSDSSCLTSTSVTSSSTTTDKSTDTTTSSTTTTDTTGSSTTEDDDTTSSGVPAPVGAANAGSNSVLGNNNAAPAGHALSAPAMALSVIAAVAALAL